MMRGGSHGSLACKPTADSNLRFCTVGLDLRVQDGGLEIGSLACFNKSSGIKTWPRASCGEQTMIFVIITIIVLMI